MNNKFKMFAILGFWLFLTFCLIFINEKIFLTGEEIRLKVQPIDPRDLLRGQYVILNYDISNIDAKEAADFERGEKVYIALKEESYKYSAEQKYDKSTNRINSGKIYTFKEISRKKPVKTPYIKGKIGYIRQEYKDNKDYKILNIKYGIENLFTSEKEAKNIEKRLSKGGIAVIKLDKAGNAKVLRVE